MTKEIVISRFASRFRTEIFEEAFMKYFWDKIQKSTVFQPKKIRRKYKMGTQDDIERYFPKVEKEYWCTYTSDGISNWYFEVALRLADTLELDIWLAESTI